MKSQDAAWEAEYRTNKMLSPSNVPQSDVVRFMRSLKKEYRKKGTPLAIEQLRVLDLGSGTGRNSYYLAEQGAQVMGFERSRTALEMARKFATHGELSIEYQNQSIGDPFPLADKSIDIVLDVTSSNALSDVERETYLREVHRVLKDEGHLFLRALSLEGDSNAKALIHMHPGSDPDTYIHPDLSLIEKVFSRESLQAVYGRYFAFTHLERVEHYHAIAGRKYKRSYWIAYLQKVPV